MKFLKKALRTGFISVCALILAACGSNGGILTPKAPDLNKCFDMTAKITQGEQHCTAKISRSGIGTWNVTFTEPYPMQGVTFSYSKEGFSATLDDLSAEKLTDDFSNSMTGVIISALETFVQDSSAAVSYTENGFTAQSGECILSFPKGSVSPEKFEIPKEKITAEISDFEIKGDIFKNGAEVVIVS